MRSTGGSGVGGGGGLARAISKRLQRFAIEFGQRSRLAQGLIVVSACLFVTIVCYSYGIATGDTRSAAHGAWTAVVDRAAHQPSSTVTVAHDRCVLVTTSEGDALCAPHFFILGAFKAGTTSLYRWLSLHPGVAVLNETRSGADHDPEHSTPSPRGGVTNIVRIKETNFFAGYNRTVTGNRGGGGSRRQFATGAEYEMARLQGRNLTAEIERALRHAPKSLADYVAIYFPTLHPEDNQITGEASPAYLFDPRVPYKLAHTFPKARLIALLRDPIERSFSRWNHLVGLRCHIKAGTGAGSVAPEFDPYLCSAAGISALFDRVVRSQLPHLKRCLIESGLTPQPIAATGGFIAPAFSQSAYESLTTCMHRANALLVTGQLQRLESAAALQAQSTVPTAPADADDDSPPPPTVDVNALTQVVRDVLFTRSCIELDFLTHSLYLFQLQNWHSYFTREQLLVIIVSHTTRSDHGGLTAGFVVGGGAFSERGTV